MALARACGHRLQKSECGSPEQGKNPCIPTHEMRMRRQARQPPLLPCTTAAAQTQPIPLNTNPATAQHPAPALQGRYHTAREKHTFVWRYIPACLLCIGTGISGITLNAVEPWAVSTIPAAMSSQRFAKRAASVPMFLQVSTAKVGLSWLPGEV